MLILTYEKFKEILKEKNLTIKKFSELVGISYKTCNSWSKPKAKPSDWVESWLRLYEENEKLKKELERHEIFKQEFNEIINNRPSMNGLNTEK